MLGRHRRWWGRAFATAAAVVVALGATTALAAWVQTRPAASGQLRSATVELTASPSVTFDVNVVGSLEGPTTVTRAITLANSGTATLEYRLAGVTHTGALVGTTVTGRFYAVPTAGACAPGTLPAQHLTTAPGDAAMLIGQSFVDWILVPATDSDVLCLALTVPAVTDPAFAVGSDPVTLSFAARSVAP